MSKTTGTKGIELIKSFEGLKLNAYICPAGVPTIGYGTTRVNGQPVQMGSVITESQASGYLKSDLQQFESAVNAAVKVPLTQNQFDALVSLCFNIGTAGFEKSTLLRLVNSNPSDPTIQQAFEAWKNAGGKPILLDRRKREYRLYTKAV